MIATVYYLICSNLCYIPLPIANTHSSTLVLVFAYDMLCLCCTCVNARTLVRARVCSLLLPHALLYHIVRRRSTGHASRLATHHCSLGSTPPSYTHQHPIETLLQNWSFRAQSNNDSHLNWQFIITVPAALKTVHNVHKAKYFTNSTVNLKENDRNESYAISFLTSFVGTVFRLMIRHWWLMNLHQHHCRLGDKTKLSNLQDPTQVPEHTEVAKVAACFFNPSRRHCPLGQCHGDPLSFEPCRPLPGTLSTPLILPLNYKNALGVAGMVTIDDWFTIIFCSWLGIRVRCRSNFIYERTVTP